MDDSISCELEDSCSDFSVHSPTEEKTNHRERSEISTLKAHRENKRDGPESKAMNFYFNRYSFLSV